MRLKSRILRIVWLGSSAKFEPQEVMHYFIPKRCQPTNKVMYHDRVQARIAADKIFCENGTELWTYQCEFCGTWHLTHHDPQEAVARTKLSRLHKPRSRKRGYKPRQR